MIGITVTFMFLNFLAFLQGPGIYQVFCFPLISLHNLLEYLLTSSFFLTIIRSGLGDPFLSHERNSGLTTFLMMYAFSLSDFLVRNYS